MKYAMIGDPSTRRLYIPHLIVAQSYDCNAKCIGCNAVGNKTKISPTQMIKIADLWKEYCKKQNNGTGIFHLKGGEPFMFSKFWDIIKHVASKRLHLFITTNGAFINKESAKKLGDLYKEIDGQIIISLDGPKEEINDLSRPGLFRHAIKSIEYLTKEGIDVAWNYRIHKGNQNNIKDAVKLAKSLGVRQFNDLYHAKIKNKNGDLELANLKLVLKDLEELYDNGFEDILEFSTVGIIRKVNSGKYRLMDCPLGYTGLKYIQPNGKETSCPNSTLIETINKIEDKYRGRFICKGELYASSQDPLYGEALRKAETLIRDKIAESFYENTKKDSKAIAWCFSRNW